MIAGFDYGRELAFESGDGAVEQGHTVRAGVPFHAFEAAVVLAGECNRNVALGFGENIHGKVGAGTEILKKGAAVIDADENERRFDGNRCEGTHGQAMRRTIGSANCRNGDAGTKQAAGIAEGFRVQSTGAAGKGVNGCS